MSNNSSSLVLGDDYDYDYMNYGAYKAGVGIWKSVPPILILLGTIGNTLSIFVLTRKSIRESTTAFYLTILAFSDLLVLYSGLLRQWLIFTFDTDVRELGQAGCKINIWLVYSSLDFSAWILIVVTLERVISAWLPHSARTVCTRPRAAVFMIVIGVFIFGLNAHLLYGMVFKYEFDEQGNVVEVIKCTYINDKYMEFFDIEWAWIDLCALCVIPFTIIVIGNSLILFKVIKSQKKAKSVVAPSASMATTGGAAPRQKTGGGRQSSMTAILFTLNVVFLVCTSPVSIYNIGYPYWVEGADDATIADLEFWWAFCNMLMYMNNSMNFLLYFLSGTKFRREVIRIFCGSCKRKRDTAKAAKSRTGARSQFDASSNRNSTYNSADHSATVQPTAGVSMETVVTTESSHNDMEPPKKSNSLHPDMALHINVIESNPANQRSEV